MLQLGRDTVPESVLGLVLFPWSPSSTTGTEDEEEGRPRPLGVEDALLLFFLESNVKLFWW